MLAVLSGARRWLRAVVAIAAGAALITLAFAFAAPHARADYQTVVNSLEQWVWLRSQTGAPISAAVVRPDGWLIVATNERFDGRETVGGGLILVPPWGGQAIPFGDPPDPATNNYGFTSLVQRGDRLFGLTSLPGQHSTTGQKARLVELDARTGKVVAVHGDWWFPDIAIDPRTNDLVLWTFHCPGKCGDDSTENTGEDVGTITHELVRYNPDSRRTMQVLLPDAMSADIGGSGTCAARRGTFHTCEEVFRIAFSNDGNTLFLGTTRSGTNAIDVRDRNGAFKFSIAAPRPIDAMRFGKPSSCFANTLVFTAYDGSAWAIPNATNSAAASSGATSIASGAPIGASGAVLSSDGNVLTLRRSEAVLLACPPWAPPKPPGPPALLRVAAPAAPAKVVASASVAHVPSPPPSHSPPPANPPPVQPPPAPPAVAGPASHAAQYVTSLNVGLADSKEEQPVYSLSASRRATSQGAWASLAVGSAAVLGFGGLTFVALAAPRRHRDARVALLRNEVRH